MAGIEDFFEVHEDDEVVDFNKEPETEVVKDEVTTEVVEDKGEPTPKDEVGEVTPKDEEAKEVVQDDSTNEAIASLRQLVREQARELSELRGQSQRLTESLTESGHIDTESLDPKTESAGVSEETTRALVLLAETMKVSPLYPEFEVICTQENFEKTVDALAKVVMKEEGGTFSAQVENVTNYIWSLPNPYKFVYDMIKIHDPKFAVKEPVKPRVAEKAPPSIGAVPGGTPSLTDGWTAAKIDSLPEDELSSVPKAIYDKYMRNELA